VHDVHVDDDRLVALQELQRDHVEPVTAPRAGTHDDGAREDPQEAADQGGTGVVPADLALGGDVDAVVTDRDAHGAHRSASASCPDGASTPSPGSTSGLPAGAGTAGAAAPEVRSAAVPVGPVPPGFSSSSSPSANEVRI